MSELPAPLLPGNCDLRDFAWTMVDFDRLLNSDTWLLSSDAEKVAALTLWGQAWRQVPAGSLPSQDALLMELARRPRDWARVKDKALRNWVLCSDGRLYHPVLCEVVLEAWLGKLAQRVSSGMGNAKRHQLVFDPTPLYAEITLCRDLLCALNPKSKALAKKLPKLSRPESRQESQQDSQLPPDGTPSGSQEKEKGKGILNTERETRAGPPVLDSSLVTQLPEIFPRPGWLGAQLLRAGKPAPPDDRLREVLVVFRAEYAGKVFSESVWHARLLAWLLKRPEVWGGSAFGGGQHCAAAAGGAARAGGVGDQIAAACEQAWGADAG